MAAMSLAVPIHFSGNDLQVMTVGTTAAALPTPTRSIVPGRPTNVFLQAYSQNSGRIYIGKTGVLADGTTGCFELPAGGNMNLPFQDWENYKAIASAAGQKLFITYQTGAQ